MSYNSNSIKVLEGLEAVRVRPGMYIGSTGSKGLHHLVNEIVDNSVDEYLAGCCTEINVSINTDGSVTIEDNGRGIPVDKHEKGIPAVRVVLTTLHAGGKFDNNNYKTAGGLHGVGAAVVNALSKKFIVEISKDGYLYVDEYENGGNPITKLVNGLLPSTGKTERTGTKITFFPDETIFETIEFKADIIRKRLKELSYLNKGLKLTLKNMNNEVEEFYSDKGLIEFIDYINRDNTKTIKDTIYCSSKKDNTEVEIAIQFINDYSENIISFCNNIGTVEGGTHVSGLKTSLTRTINQYAKDMGVFKGRDESFEGRDIRRGIVAIISIKHPNPQYEGQTKTKLGNTEIRGIVDEVVSSELQIYLDKNAETLKQIIDNSLKSLALRKAETKVRENFLNKSMKLAVNGKLASCKADSSRAELYIVEGDSAGGTAKQGRDRTFQAILPLKGKILNIEKLSIDKVLKNTEITTLISALECGFGEGLGDDFDINKLRYSKIILMTDADVDGAHIRTLLLTFFYRYMPELIYSGKIYIGMPPLYKVTRGKEDVYVYDDKELEDYRKKNKNITSIQRYKGLGEMNAEQLWSTTMNPDTRVLKQVSINNNIESDEVTSILMGVKVPPRREFIFNEGSKAKIDT